MKAMKLPLLATLAVAATLTSCGGSVNGSSRTILQNKGSDTLALATCAMLVGRLWTLPALVQRLAQRSVRLRPVC